MRVVVVGPCASGKSVLVEGLTKLGYEAQACAQEHSYVPTMWQMDQPDLLVYLDATLATIRRRRQDEFPATELAAQQKRLANARQHCHLYLKTDDLNIEKVLRRVRRFVDRSAKRKK
jgi:deoxyadenosine/deoxycytidine kinase